MKRNKIIYLAIAAFTQIAAVSGQAKAAPILLTNVSGLLTGATGVDVDGALYDVEFKIGSYWQYGATAVQNPMFDEAGSSAASMALLQQVFVDGPAGNFDSNPAATIVGDMPVFTIFGANTNTGVPLGYYARNLRFIPDCLEVTRNCDFVAVRLVNTFLDAYAFWTPHVSAPVSVPEPSTLASVLLALVALGASRSSRRQAQSG